MTLENDFFDDDIFQMFGNAIKEAMPINSNSDINKISGMVKLPDIGDCEPQCAFDKFESLYSRILTFMSLMDNAREQVLKLCLNREPTYNYIDSAYHDMIQMIRFVMKDLEPAKTITNLTKISLPKYSDNDSHIVDQKNKSLCLCIMIFQIVLEEMKGMIFEEMISIRQILRNKPDSNSM